LRGIGNEKDSVEIKISGVVDHEGNREVLDKESAVNIARIERENNSVTHTLDTKISQLEQLQQEFSQMKKFINNDLMGDSCTGIEFSNTNQTKNKKK